MKYYFYTGTLKLICYDRPKANGSSDCKGHKGPSGAVGTLIYLILVMITWICTLVKLITCTCKTGLVHYMVNYTSIKLILKESKGTKSKPDPMRSLLWEQFLLIIIIAGERCLVNFILLLILSMSFIYPFISFGGSWGRVSYSPGWPITK